MLLTRNMLLNYIYYYNNLPNTIIKLETSYDLFKSQNIITYYQSQLCNLYYYYHI